MASIKDPKRLIRKPETVRERTGKSQKTDGPKPRRFRKAAKTVSRPFKIIHSTGKKEYYLPMPDNRLGKFLNKRRSLVPRFFREAWQEILQTSWPNARETAKLTFAVVLFAIAFGVVTAIVDFGLEKIFREVIL